MSKLSGLFLFLIKKKPKYIAIRGRVYPRASRGTVADTIRRYATKNIASNKVYFSKLKRTKLIRSPIKTNKATQFKLMRSLAKRYSSIGNPSINVAKRIN